MYKKIHLHAIIFHAVMIRCHEDDINQDTEGDEELCKGVKHHKREHLENNNISKFDISHIFI